MTYLEYYFECCFLAGWRSVARTFHVWKDLLSNNYEPYLISKKNKNDGLKECAGWFWAELGCDDVVPKWFYEDLRQLMARIESNQEELIAIDWDLLDRLTEEPELLEGLWNGNV